MIPKKSADHRRRASRPPSAACSRSACCNFYSAQSAAWPGRNHGGWTGTHADLWSLAVQRRTQPRRVLGQAQVSAIGVLGPWVDSSSREARSADSRGACGPARRGSRRPRLGDGR